MSQKENTAIKSWLTANGYTFKTYEGMDGIMVNTNYDGEHPKAETFKAHYHIEQYVGRFHKTVKTEPRGHWTGLWIWSR